MKKILFFLLFGVLLVSCGKKEVKQVSPESKSVMDAFSLAETVKNAFIIKDSITLQKSSTAEGYKDITANSSAYDKVEITFTPRWVDIENNQLHVNISWKSSWVVSGKRTDDRGMAVFLIEGTPMKVAKILRANPFISPKQ